MKLFFIEFIILSIIFFEKSYKGNIIKDINNSTINGIYIISNSERNLYFSIENNILMLSNIKKHFRLILVKPKSYLIESRLQKKIIGVDEKDNIKIYNKYEHINNNKIYWNIIKIRNMEFLLQNEFNNNFIEANDNQLKCSNKITSNDFTKSNISLKKKYIFRFLKLFEEGKENKFYLNIIKKEPIDVVIKYIDLTDKTLNRIGIIQIYKDENNEELKYSIRSIIQNIPWVRKIYILMPNENVKFFKSQDKIKDKIIYINDKDILGFDSANIHSFTFNLYKMEKFNISRNFIYLEDDFFIGKSLEKKDFFYYDENKKKIVPYILTFYFNELNITEILKEYNYMEGIKHLIHPHSGEGWKFSILSTQKYFLEKYKFQIINTRFTHNAIAENVNDLKEIYEEIKDYEYINETLFAKERNILTLNQPYFLNLYTLNIKNRKVHSIPYKYIPIESINKIRLNMALFVLNTGGNHIPLKRHYNIQKKIMSKRFPFYNKYEILNDKIKNIFNNFNKGFIIIFKIFLFLNIIKINFLINLI